VFVLEQTSGIHGDAWALALFVLVSGYAC